MSATVAAALKKAAVYILGDEKKRGKLVTAVLSAAVGLLLLLCAPAVMLSSLGEVGEEAQVPELHLNAYDIYSSLDSESRQRLDDIRSAGNDIANAMDEKGVKVHTIKAQLIYMSYFDEVQNFYAESYANLFAAAPNDSDLINAINSTYGLEIDYDEFIRTYTWVMNSTLNPYMFNDAGSKNCTDLAAWAENAFISGWGYTKAVLSVKEMKQTASDMLTTQDLCLGILTTARPIKRSVLITVLLFIQSKEVLILCRRSQAWDCSTAVSTVFMSVTARSFSPLPIAAM